MRVLPSRARRRSGDFRRRLAALRARVGALAELRRTVALPPDADLTPRQWTVIEGGLAGAERRHQSRLKAAAALGLPRLDDDAVAGALNGALGEIEVELAHAYDVFDTFVDLLTQRASPTLGRVLAGCDVIARAALELDHPALAMVEPPLVYCDRGFGASILREGLRLPNGLPNPMPLIQLPYSRLAEKYNLGSLVHEAGHEGLARLGLVAVLPRAAHDALARRGAAPQLAELYARWMREIGPDFWAFCLTGVAQAAGIRDVVSLPPAQVFHVSWTDPHPPPYVRVLLSLHWCEHAWGAGMWTAWASEWTTFYPARHAPPATRELLAEAVRLVPWVTDVLFTTRFRALSGRTLPELFDLAGVAPARLRAARAGTLPTLQRLAAFRLAREDGAIAEDALDGAMTAWLESLAAARSTLPRRADPSPPLRPSTNPSRQVRHV